MNRYERNSGVDIGRIVLSPLVTDRIAKLIPRLASNHDGEVIATVAAIRRTLDGAGLDLHDLAECIGMVGIPMPHIVDPPVRTPYARERTPDEWAEANEKMREAEAAKWAKVTPWRRLSHFGRIEQLDRVAKAPLAFLIPKDNRDAFDALRAKIVQRPQEIVTRKEINLFNKLVRALWAIDEDRKEAA